MITQAGSAIDRFAATPSAALAGEALCLRPDALRAGHRLTLHRDGSEAYPRMLQAIRDAQKSVLLETYTFSDDATGRRFADTLADRARAGVDVRVLYDSLGSRATDHAFFGELRARGVRVVPFHPLARWFAGFPFRARDHRKLLVVDARVAFVGGLNIAREYASIADGGLGWRDTQVEIEGPNVLEMQDMFLELWTRERKRDPPLFKPPRTHAPEDEGARMHTVSSQRLRDRWEIARHYRHAIENARHRIWIASAYFLPSMRFSKRLRAARRRGVDVRLLVPGRTDFGPVLYAAQRLFTSYLLAGIRVFEWPGPMMHAKTMVVDGMWSTVGSYNIDHLSVVRNYELIAVVSDADFGRRMEAMFEEDIARSKEITRNTWRNRSWGQRILEQLFYSFRRVF
jgi:cardiolipin synthase